MVTRELTREEEDRLYAISCIPAVIISTAIALHYLFFRLEQIYPPGAPFEPVMWDVLPRFFLPLLTWAPISFILTFEILYHRKIKKPLKFHVKRFMGRTLVLLIGMALFYATWIPFIFLYPLISASYALIWWVIFFIIWSLTFYVILTKFKGFFSKLEKGE